MMMTGRSRSRVAETYSRFIRTGVVIGIVVLVGTILAPYIRDLIVAARVTSDVYSHYALTPRSVLIERLDRAEGELQRIRYQSVLFQNLQDENVLLKSMSAFTESRSYGTARVVAVPPRTHYDTIVIAAGSSDGVLVADRVSVQGILIGTVTAVSPGSAIAELFTSPGRETDIELGTPKGTAVMRGLGGGTAETTVPDTMSVRIGDTVATKAGGVVGSVLSVAKRETDTSATVRIGLPISVAALRMVSLTHE